MVYFQSKNLNFGTFSRALEWKMFLIFYDHLEYCMAIKNNLWQSGIVCGHLLYFSHLGKFWPR
jgi:hypothetical protein